MSATAFTCSDKDPATVTSRSWMPGIKSPGDDSLMFAFDSLTKLLLFIWGKGKEMGI
jgi:hypothetical protein